MPGRLPVDIASVTKVFFERLERESEHGRVLVASAVRYLCAARRGLAEQELVVLLSRDSEVMDDFVRRSPTEQGKQPEDRLKSLPPIVWSRLFDDLRPYLIEREAPGGTVLDFYHRSIRHVAEERYFADGQIKKYRQHIADYFSAQTNHFRTGVPNARKADELPFLMAKNDQWKDLAELLAGNNALSFLEAKIESRLVEDLVHDLANTASEIGATDSRQKFLSRLAEAIRRNGSWLMNSPSPCFNVCGTMFGGLIRRSPTSFMLRMTLESRILGMNI